MSVVFVAAVVMLHVVVMMMWSCRFRSEKKKWNCAHVVFRVSSAKRSAAPLDPARSRAVSPIQMNKSSSFRLEGVYNVNSNFFAHLLKKVVQLQKWVYPWDLCFKMSYLYIRHLPVDLYTSSIKGKLFKKFGYCARALNEVRDVSGPNEC